MKKLLFINFSLVLYFLSAQGFEFEEMELEDFSTLYVRWRNHYSVERSLDEIDHRLNVFKYNVNYVHNTMTRPYNRKLNKFTDWTFEEFTNTYGDCVRPDYESEEQDIEIGQGMSERETQVPDSVDWRNESAVTEVKNQGNCGSCWTFSTVAAVEAINKINGGDLVSLSAQELLDCDTNNKGCSGGQLKNAFNFIKENSGITTDELYTYKAIQENCTAPKTSTVSIDGYNLVPKKNETELATAVARQPISILFDINNLTFMLYTGGVFKGPCGNNLTHAMTVIGYGLEPNNGTKFWIVKNSHGVGWGDKGYLLVEKDIEDTKGRCGIAMFPYYPTQKPPPSPSSQKDELR